MFPPVTLVGPANDDAKSALVDKGGLIKKLSWSQASCSGVNGGGVLIVKPGSGGGTQGNSLTNGEASRDYRQPVL